MSRNLSSSLQAQNSVEKKSKSKFDGMQEILFKQNSPKVKLTVTVNQEDSEFLKKEVFKRSQERGVVLNLSQVLREIINEYKTTKEGDLHVN